jgi:hypothetical protein
MKSYHELSKESIVKTNIKESRNETNEQFSRIETLTSSLRVREIVSFIYSSKTKIVLYKHFQWNTVYIDIISSELKRFNFMFL